MEIDVQKDALTRETVLKITVSQEFIATQCRPLPEGFASLINLEQGFGIIEDAVLMAMKMEKLK